MPLTPINLPPLPLKRQFSLTDSKRGVLTVLQCRGISYNKSEM
uniref:Uncharacterized protein n=1 Tax=Rhizophora mucronata TaxID=61149 RepID=A0A2P2NET5_RHIMU